VLLQCCTQVERQLRQGWRSERRALWSRVLQRRRLLRCAQRRRYFRRVQMRCRAWERRAQALMATREREMLRSVATLVVTREMGMLRLMEVRRRVRAGLSRLGPVRAHWRGSACVLVSQRMQATRRVQEWHRLWRRAHVWRSTCVQVRHKQVRQSEPLWCAQMAWRTQMGRLAQM
jgi:hypothetical protein